MLYQNILSITKSRILLALMFSCLSFSAHALSYKSYTLDNGLEAYLIKTSNPIVTHIISYSVGAVEETSPQEGLAHLLEHMMFLGTNRYSKVDFSNAIKSFGGYYNAFTSSDITLYYINAPSLYLDEIMKIEADRMQWLLLQDEVVENEKKVVNEERNSGNNQPYSEFFKSFMQAAFPTTNYGRSVIGWEEPFNNITTKNLRDFYAKWYVPNNAKVFVIGNIDFDKTYTMLKKHYGFITKKNLPQRPDYNEKPYKSVINIKHKNTKINQEIALKSYLVPSHNSDLSLNKKDSLSLMILEEILSSKSGKLYQKLVVEKKIATDVATVYDSTSKGHSSFYFLVVPASGYTNESVMKELEQELEKIIKNGFKDNDVRRSINKLRDNLEFLAEDDQDYIVSLARNINGGMKVDFFMGIIDKLSEIDGKYLSNLAKNLLKQNYIKAEAFKN